jgi:1-acyl-sn-glycerol-3-phosphate acyltransferase
VLVCNHVSFVDPIVIAAASRRPIRFVMDYRIYRTPMINFVFRHMPPSRLPRRATTRR